MTKIKIKSASKGKFRCEFSFEKSLDVVDGIGDILRLLGFIDSPNHNIKDLIYNERTSKSKISDVSDEVYGMENDDYFVNVFIGAEKIVLIINSRKDRQEDISHAVFRFADFEEKKKSVLAVSLSGFLINSRPWKEAHKIGMKEHFNVLGIDSIPENNTYYDVVDKALEAYWPDIEVEHRIAINRRIYFTRVLGLIKDSDVNEYVIEFLRSIKNKYRLVLITSNNLEMTENILEKIDCKDLFDEMFVSLDSEKDDKVAVFDRMIGSVGKPEFLVEGGERLIKSCEEGNIKHIKFSNVGKLKEILEDGVLNNMTVTKEIFEIIFWIKFMRYNNPKQLSNQMELSEDELETKLNKLKDDGLIEIEFRDGEIYSSRLTAKGMDIWNDDKYMEQKVALGY